MTSASPSYLFTKILDKGQSSILLHHHSSGSAALNNIHYLKNTAIWNWKNWKYPNMPKFEKGNTQGFKFKSVPSNKGMQRVKEKIVPAPYERLPPEMDQLVKDPPSASEKQEMLPRPWCHHLLRPGSWKMKVEMSAGMLKCYTCK